jgi:hypothetical protein
MNKHWDVNIAVVFSGPLPKIWRGRKVIDGDTTDLRFLDPRGIIVGLKAKGRAKSENSGFVIQLPVVESS